MTILFSFVLAFLLVQEPKQQVFVCIDHMLTVRAVERLPSRTRHSQLFYKWRTQELWAKHRGNWYIIPKERYELLPGKCGWRQ